MTPLAHLLSPLPRPLASVLMVLIYAACLLSLALTLGYQYQDPILYLNAQ